MVGRVTAPKHANALVPRTYSSEGSKGRHTLSVALGQGLLSVSDEAGVSFLPQVTLRGGEAITLVTEEKSGHRELKSLAHCVPEGQCGPGLCRSSPCSCPPGCTISNIRSIARVHRQGTHPVFSPGLHLPCLVGEAPFYEWGTEAQRGQVSCQRSHNQGLWFQAFN